MTALAAPSITATTVVATGANIGETIPVPQGPAVSILSAVGFKPDANSLAESVVDFACELDITEEGELRCLCDMRDYRLVVYVERCN